MSRLNYLAGLTAVLAMLVLFYALLPLGSALEFGGDEGIELIKGFMCSKGFALYKDIWNDQPPLFTVLLAAGFKAFGPSLLAALLIAAGLSLLLFGVVYSLVSQRAGMRAAFLAMATPWVPRNPRRIDTAAQLREIL